MPEAHAERGGPGGRRAKRRVGAGDGEQRLPQEVAPPLEGTAVAATREGEGRIGRGRTVAGPNWARFYESDCVAARPGASLSGIADREAGAQAELARQGFKQG